MMHSLLNQALSLSSAINREAGRARWNEIGVLAAQRHDILQAYFALSPLPDGNDVIFKVVQEIRKNDKFVSEIIEKNKQISIGESLDLQAAGRAINRYRQNSNHSSR